MKMNLRPLVAAILIISIIGALLGFEPEDRFEAVFTGHSFVIKYRNDSNPLNLTSRANIYDFIQSNPGAHLRRICSCLSISIGSAQYHLDQLLESKLIESEKESKYRRFFVSRKFSAFEKMVIAFLRKPNARLIMKYTSTNEGCSHQELSRLLGISSQAVTWHIKRLLDENMIEARVWDNSTYYRISDKACDTLLVLGLDI